MNEKQEATRAASQPSAKHEGGAVGFGRDLDHNRVIGLYLGGCVALTVLAAALLLSSCGGERSQQTSVASESSPPQASEPTAVPAMSVSPSGTAMPASVSMPQAGAAEGLPPEIALGETPSVVAPGEAVTFTVYGTPDVTEMSLWDGLNDRQAFVHDGSGDVWRVDYRVPLRPKQERIGLSVTAKNQAGRWRRVWVFLQVASTAEVAKAEEPAAPIEPSVAAVDSVIDR